MPLYTFRNKQTSEEWEESMSIREMEQKIKDKNFEIVLSAPVIRSTFEGKKPDQKFRRLLQGIKKKHKESNINTF